MSCILIKHFPDHDNKSIILLSPDVRIQTELKKSKTAGTGAGGQSGDSRKKSIIDSGIELLFKKSHSKNSAKDVGSGHSPPKISHPLSNDYYKYSADVTTVPTNFVDRESSSHHGHSALDEHHKWKLFDTIKIHTDRRRSHDPNGMCARNRMKLTIEIKNRLKYLVFFAADVHLGEECVGGGNQAHEITPIYKLHNDSAVLDQHGSPKKKFRAMLSGHKQIDQLLHTIINYILRDFIDSWFFSLSDNKEFSEFRTRNCIEESVQNVCNRVKTTQWTPLITTKLVDIIAMHARLYRKANATLNLQLDEAKSTSPISTSSFAVGGHANAFQSINNTASPQKRSSARKLSQHRRNKSETDLNLNTGGSGQQSIQRTFGNSKFYESLDPNRKSSNASTDKCNAGDASEAKLITAFFNQCESYRDECLNDQALEGIDQNSIFKFFAVVSLPSFKL